MGMGKGAGNLNTELLLEHLNLFYGKSYDIAPLLDVMDKVLKQIQTEFSGVILRILSFCSKSLYSKLC